MKSELATKVSLSPNHSGKRVYDITRITPHVVVGEFDAETVASWFNKPERKASANYIIGKSGEILLNVDEENRAWTSGSFDNDNRAITIECSSDAKNHNALNEKVYASLENLIVDICKRYNKKRVVYKATPNYNPTSDEMLITKHAFFQNVLCWDKWLDEHINELVCNVNKRLAEKPDILYKVQVGAFSVRSNAENLRDKLRSNGYSDAFIVTERINKQ